MSDIPAITPATPGKDISFIKPNVPGCWTPQPVIQEKEEANA